MQEPHVWRRRYLVGKSGEKGNQDAAWASTKNRRFAVADGVSQTTLPGDWADLLVKRFTRVPLESPGAVEDWAEPIQDRWRQKQDLKTLPWNVRLRLQEGASSTLVGLEIHQAEEDCSKIKWRTTVIGDSCLFHVSGKDLEVSFPLKSAEQFGYVTPGMSTQKKDPGYYWQHLKSKCGYCQPGDDFFLTTDALAEWIIRQTDITKDLKDAPWPWRKLRSMKTKDQFETWIEELRSTGDLHDDDVAFIRVSISKLKPRV